jgi:hypothetical protein
VVFPTGPGPVPTRNDGGLRPPRRPGRDRQFGRFAASPVSVLALVIFLVARRRECGRDSIAQHKSAPKWRIVGFDLSSPNAVENVLLVRMSRISLIRRSTKQSLGTKARAAPLDRGHRKCSMPYVQTDGFHQACRPLRHAEGCSTLHVLGARGQTNTWRTSADFPELVSCANIDFFRRYFFGTILRTQVLVSYRYDDLCPKNLILLFLVRVQVPQL